MSQLLFSILILSIVIIPSFASEFFGVFALQNDAAEFVRENFLPESFLGEATSTLSAAPEKETATEKEAVKAPVPPKIAETIREEAAKFVAPILSQKPLLTSDVVYQLLDTAVVQVVCRLGDRLSISGSGVVISSSGIVLTNTHVVENATDCFVRTGNPAAFAGRLKILYRGNSEEKIPDTEVPLEDFAFGKITDVPASSRFALPFKYLPANASYPHALSERYFLAAYASEFAGGGGTTPQNLVFTITKLLGFFAIAGDGQEVLELEGNVSTQEGASGSPIISPVDGSVIGLVFGQNKGEGEVETAKRTEYAFSLSYIDRVLRKKEGMGLQDFVAKLE